MHSSTPQHDTKVGIAKSYVLLVACVRTVTESMGNSISVHQSFANDPLRIGRNLVCG